MANQWARIVKQYITPNKEVACIAFLGAGEAENEVQRLEALKNVGVTTKQVAFMESCFTNNAIQKYTALQVQPEILFTFKELIMLLQFEHTLLTKKQIILIARDTFVPPHDLNDCHDFMCKCAQWAQYGLIHTYFKADTGQEQHETNCTVQYTWWELNNKVFKQKKCMFSGNCLQFAETDNI